MPEFMNPFFMHLQSSPKAFTPTPSSPSAHDFKHDETALAHFDCMAEPRNQPSQMATPIVSRINIPCNCGGDGWNTCAHHCAKLFNLEVEIQNLSSRPVVEIPKKRDFEGDYKSKPGRLQSKMLFSTAGGGQKETLLNLGVATIMSGASELEDPAALEKHRVGLQYCKAGADKHVPVEWIPDESGVTGTAIMTFKVRARRIRQNANGWELKDDAGSGIRGKPHDSSAFRFWACLQYSDFSLSKSKPVDEIIQAAIISNSGTYKCEDVRVWSKGNCPGKTRKNGSPGSSPRSPQQRKTQVTESVAAPTLPFLPIPISAALATQGTKRSVRALSHLNTSVCQSFTPVMMHMPNGAPMVPIINTLLLDKQQVVSGGGPHKRVKPNQNDGLGDLNTDDLMDQLDMVHDVQHDDIDEIEALINSLQDHPNQPLSQEDQEDDHCGDWSLLDELEMMPLDCIAA